PGTILATFSGSPPTYSGQHGLWYASDCSFGAWDPGSFTLSGNTLTFTSPGGYPPATFTQVPPITLSSLTPLPTLQTQTIVVSGSGFGTHVPFNGDLPCIEITDLTAGWSAGHGDPAYAPGTDTGAACSTAQSSAVDLVTIRVSSW